MHLKNTQTPKFDTKKIAESKLKEEWETEEANTREKLEAKIIQKAQKLIPLIKNKKQPWWDLKCEKALERRRKAFQEYNGFKSQSTLDTFNETRKQASKSI